METLSCIYLNARSICNKLSDLEQLAKTRNPDIIMICESWLNEHDSNKTLNIDGYNLESELRKDRTDTTGGIGGGLLVYTKIGIIIKPVNIDIDFNQFCQFEVVSKNEHYHQNLNFTLVYRPPKKDENNLLKLCEIIEKVPENSVLIGDFNYRNIDWINELSDNSQSEKFLDVVRNNNMEQMIDFPTHSKGGILDLVLTNRPENIISVDCLGNLGNSDHSIIETVIRFSSKIQDNDTLVCDWKNCKQEELKEYFEKVEWQNILAGKSVKEQWDVFKTVINTGLDKYVPMKKLRDGKKCSWMTKKVRNLLNRKQRCFRLVKTCASEENVKQLKVIERKCKNAIRNAKKSLEKKLSEQGDMKPFQAYVRQKTKTKTNVGPLRRNNDIISDNKEMAEMLNSYFVTVFTLEDESNLPNTPEFEGIKIENFEMSKKQIETKIKKLKTFSAPGPDKISSKILKDYSSTLSNALCIIFNNSLQSSEIPTDWKTANVTPIHKKGTKGNVENYRPVSLTSIPCKLMESLLKDKIMDHLLDQQILKSSQHGFMKNKSTVTNLLEFFEKITDIVDQGEAADVIYLDFSKAFDKVPAKRLIEKMKSCGINGNVLSWIEEWLTGRYQRTVLNGKCSSWELVLSGVPQGSVLGPLAFIVFINDLDQAATLIEILNKFADDTKMGNKIITDEDYTKIQKTLDELVHWSNEWGMKFNEKKCTVVHFGGKKNKEHVYYMNNIPLNKSTLEKDLGILVSSDLKPSAQCVNAIKNARIALRNIETSFLYRDHKVFVKIYKQYVRCHLEYASQVWSPWTAVDIDKLEKVQQKAVNMIYGLDGLQYEEKLKKLNLETLKERRIKADLAMVYRILNGHCDVDSSIWFKTVNTNRQNTRSSSYPLNLEKKRFNLEIRKNFFSNRVIDNWNKLSVDIKESNSVKEFKNKLSKIKISDL